MIAPTSPSRRRRRIALMLAGSLMGWATAAPQAATVPTEIVRVTAGEHEEFSRVVFALGGIGYQTVPEPGGLRVVVPNALVEFDYDDVYPKGRARRVIGAEPSSGADGAALRLRFGCDCTVRTFMLDTKLVVDVFDGPPGATGAPAAGPAPQVPSAASGGDRGTLPQAAPRAGLAQEHDPGQPRPEFLRWVESMAIPQPRPPEPADAGAVESFDPQHLQRMLEWAIDQGHLTDAQGDSHGRPSPAAKPDDATAATATPAPADPPSPMAASSATEAPPVAPMEAEEPGSAGSCPDGAALDMAVLGGQGAFDAELAYRQDALSRALATERGEQEAQYALAGFYLARLMPQEALEALREPDGQQADPARVWLETAALVLADRSNEVAGGTFRDTPCEGADAQVWRAVVLAAQGPIARETLATDVILDRLATYPPGLRVELGLRLAEAGVNGAAPAALERLLDLVDAAAVATEARARLLFLRGRLAAERGDFAGAKANWSAAAELPGEGGARATLALLQADLEDGGVDQAAALSELERLAYDWRGHPLQLAIAQLTAAVHERQDHLVLALGALEEIALSAAGRADGRAAARAATDLMRRSYVGGSRELSTDRLAAFWRYEGFVPPGPEGTDIRLAFAQALIAHGLPSMATGVLEPVARSASGPLEDQALDLVVEGYIAAHEPSKALDALRIAAPATSIARPRRNLLAARALADLGRFAEAAGVLHEIAGDEARQLQADYLWKAGLWKKSAVAYRDQLRERQQGQSDLSEQAVIRLAAAAYMAEQPAIFDELLANGTRPDRIIAAFAPLPKLEPTPHSDGVRAEAARLVEQARGLGELAEQYGLQEQAPR